MKKDLLFDTTTLRAISDSASKIYDVFELPFRMEKLRKEFNKAIAEIVYEINRLKYGINIMLNLIELLVEKEIISEEETKKLGETVDNEELQ